MNLDELVRNFKKNITNSQVLIPKGIHHEFVSGLHGRKLDFDLIDEKSDLFRQWVEVVAQFIKKQYSDISPSKIVLLSVAGGTNRLVGPVAKAIGGGVTALLTEKTSARSVRLTDEAKKKLKALKPELVVALEDVGTRGGTAASAVLSAQEAGAKRVEVLNTWQRSEVLEALEAIDATYNAIIKEIWPNFTTEECRKTGYCAQGWKLIEHA